MLGDKGRSTSIKEKKTGPIQGLEITFFFFTSSYNGKPWLQNAEAK